MCRNEGGGGDRGEDWWEARRTGGREKTGTEIERQSDTESRRVVREAERATSGEQRMKEVS